LLLLFPLSLVSPPLTSTLFTLLVDCKFCPLFPLPSSFGTRILHHCPVRSPPPPLLLCQYQNPPRPMKGGPQFSTRLKPLEFFFIFLPFFLFVCIYGMHFTVEIVISVAYPVGVWSPPLIFPPTEFRGLDGPHLCS